MELTMNYQAMTKAVTDAIKGEINTVNKWQTAGSQVREFFGTESALNEVKAQFIADAIIPALDKRHAAALNMELMRKGSKEYNALDADNKALWEAMNQAKKDARATAHTMFSRVVGYAFPKEKTESVPKALETKLVDLINDAIGKIEKAESVEFDAVNALVHLRATLAIISK
jgi:hypothetical protein